MKRNKYFLLSLLLSMSLSACEDLTDLISDDPRDAFTGEWKVDEVNTLKTNDPVTYYVNIKKSSTDSTLVYISNFYEMGAGTSIDAKVTGGSISIPSQSVGGFVISGQGTIAYNDKSIDWSYTVDYRNGFIDYVSATYTKQ
ncbi:MAG: hypothetical protein H6539_05190 [Bacteroidales bacterium]|nr:hypothetical protein [Bacteroidales bacterium]